MQEGASSHLFTELFRQEVKVVLVGRGFLPIPQQIELRQHLFVMVLKLPVEETKKTISST